MSWALISGATSGIGRACAIRFAEAGVNLVLLGRRAERLKSLESEIANRVSVRTLVVDVRDADAIAAATGAGLPDIDVLLNNAGLAKGTEKIPGAALGDWDQMIDTNVKGLLYLTRALVPGMIARNRGHVVNIGSVAGRYVYPGGAVYCATKFAVRALTEGLRMDLLGTPLRVTNIAPGMVESEFSTVRLGDADQAARVYAGMQPLTPEDIAEAVWWCVDRPAHVNVQELVVYPTAQAAPGLVHRG